MTLSDIYLSVATATARARDRPPTGHGWQLHCQSLIYLWEWADGIPPAGFTPRACLCPCFIDNPRKTHSSFFIAVEIPSLYACRTPGA